MRLLLLLIATFVIQSHQIEHKITDQGLKLASELLRGSLNESVQPCQDFFEFTCKFFEFKFQHFIDFRRKLDQQKLHSSRSFILRQVF